MIPHLREGDRLYAAITHRTLNCFLGHYLPRSHFVLEVFVKEVSDGAGGVMYFFDTGFYLDHAFVSKFEHEAKEAVTRIFEKEHGFSMPLDKVCVISWEDYNRESKAHEAKMRA